MARDHTGRPRLTSNRRRSWRQFFLSEWGLLLLAAALTFIIWNNVREKVIREHLIANIRVVLDVVPDGVGAVLVDDDKVDIKVECSEREKDEITAQLREDGQGELRVTMLVRDVPVQRERTLTTVDRFQWKFDVDRVLKEVKNRPQGVVFRIKTQNLLVVRADTGPIAKGIEVDIVPDPKTVPLAMPIAALDEGVELVPDSLNLGEFMKTPEFQPDTPYTFTLTFDGWKSVKDKWRGVYREGLTIPPVRATVTVREVGTRSIQNTLLVLLDPNNYEYELNVNDLGGVVELTEGGLEFSGTLKGRTAALTELAAAKSKWRWAVRVNDPAQLPPPPPEEGKDSEWRKLEASIVWLAFPPFRDRAIEFEPQPGSGQDAFDLKVRWHPAHKK